MGSCKPGRLDILGPGRGASPYRTSTRPPLFRWAQTEHSKWFVTRTLSTPSGSSPGLYSSFLSSQDQEDLSEGTFQDDLSRERNEEGE
jgi:hypothetical protein